MIMIERKIRRNAKIGIFAVAHGVYWEQFDGLYENIMKYHKDFCNIVGKNDVEIIDFGMVDSSEKAFEVVSQMKAQSLDLIFRNMELSKNVQSKVDPKSNSNLNIEKSPRFDGVKRSGTESKRGGRRRLSRLFQILCKPPRWYRIKGSISHFV